MYTNIQQSTAYPFAPPIISGPFTIRKLQSTSFAIARAIIVFPVPGGPCIKTPFGGFTPIDVNNFG